jgi:hypothetical protein
MFIEFRWTVARPKYTGQLNIQANESSQHSFNNFMGSSEKYRITNKYILYIYIIYNIYIYKIYILQPYYNFVNTVTSHKLWHITNCDISQIVTSHKLRHLTNRGISQIVTSHKLWHFTNCDISQIATSHKLWHLTNFKTNVCIFTSI